ncbi:unnamed protein product [Choristocarpus tenellus]
MEFCLSSDARHARAEEEFKERVRREEEEARRAAEVHALPLPPATFESLDRPVRSDKTLTQPVKVVLHSAARAQGRAQWEEENQARIERNEAERRDTMIAREEEERMAVAELRSRPHTAGGMSFKAKPIEWTNAAPSNAMLSSAPLTTPVTPKLLTKTRAAIRREAPLA